jgi:hypothetical protein
MLRDRRGRGKKTAVKKPSRSAQKRETVFRLLFCSFRGKVKRVTGFAPVAAGITAH